MSQPPAPPGPPADRDADLVAERAHLLPEELAAGSADPELQAEAILAESEDRTEHPGETQAESPQTAESHSEETL